MNKAGNEKGSIVLKTMGSMDFGGTVHVRENGETFHGDHGYAQYFIPEKSKNWPIIMWHGMGQSGRCWETTPDGREGFWQVFTRAGYPVYIIDQARRGRAGYTDAPLGELAMKSPVVQFESAAWNTFRFGYWTPSKKCTAFEGTALPITPDTIETFFRMQAPDTGDEPICDEYRKFMADNMKQLLEEAGPSILFTHSNSGQYGWYTAMAAPELVKGIWSYEPGHCVFPEDYEIPYITSPVQEMVDELLQPYRIPREEFMKLTKIPIVIFYGDFISEKESDDFNVEVWRISLIRAHQMVDLLNAYGGNAKVVELTKHGIMGNSHSGFSDGNSDEVAALYMKYLEEAGLAAEDHPYQGPVMKKRAEFTIPIEIK